MKYIFTFLFFNFSLYSMDYKEAKLVVWKTGEALYGDEFISSSENVVDYLASLDRPDHAFKSIRYNCLIKSRKISLKPRTIGANLGESTYTYITTVYGIKDCAKI